MEVTLRSCDFLFWHFFVRHAQATKYLQNNKFPVSSKRFEWFCWILYLITHPWNSGYPEDFRRRYTGLGAQIKGKPMQNNVSYLIIPYTQMCLHVVRHLSNTLENDELKTIYACVCYCSLLKFFFFFFFMVPFYWWFQLPQG